MRYSVGVVIGRGRSGFSLFRRQKLDGIDGDGEGVRDDINSEELNGSESRLLLG